MALWTRAPERHQAEGRAPIEAPADVTPTKRCPRCGETKPREAFGVRANGYSRSACRPCEGANLKRWAEENPEARAAAVRSTTLRRYYGITPAQFEALEAGQGGVCLICGQPEPGRRGRLHVDHDHETGIIRGLLCCNCNRAIGYLGDDPDRADALAAYLRATPPPDALVAVPAMPSGVDQRGRRGNR